MLTQGRERFVTNESGVSINKDTATALETGKVLVQGLLDEMSTRKMHAQHRWIKVRNFLVACVRFLHAKRWDLKHQPMMAASSPRAFGQLNRVMFLDWCKSSASSPAAQEAAVQAAAAHYLRTVKDSEPITNLPAHSRIGSTRLKSHVRRIVEAIKAGLEVHYNRSIPNGYLWFNSFKAARNILEGRERASSGKDARMRRDNNLFDDEQISLFESMLGNKVALHQELVDRLKVDERDKPFDTLMLALVNILYYALGKRGVDVSEAFAALPICFAFAGTSLWFHDVTAFPSVCVPRSLTIWIGANSRWQSTTNMRHGKAER